MQGHLLSGDHGHAVLFVASIGGRFKIIGSRGWHRIHGGPHERYGEHAGASEKVTVALAVVALVTGVPTVTTVPDAVIEGACVTKTGFVGLEV